MLEALGVMKVGSGSCFGVESGKKAAWKFYGRLCMRIQHGITSDSGGEQSGEIIGSGGKIEMTGRERYRDVDIRERKA